MDPSPRYSTNIKDGDRNENEQEQPDAFADVAADGCRGILDRMVDPAVEMCVVASEEKHRVRPSWDREVFVINAMTYLQVCLSFPCLVRMVLRQPWVECVRCPCRSFFPAHFRTVAIWRSWETIFSISRFFPPMTPSCQPFAVQLRVYTGGVALCCMRVVR